MSDFRTIEEAVNIVKKSDSYACLFDDEKLALDFLFSALQRYKTALEFYKEPLHYLPDTTRHNLMAYDKGKTAQQALLWEMDCD